MTRKERQTLQAMYRALEELPGRIRRGEDAPATLDEAQERTAQADGAERARVLVYTWLREAGMLPPGGR